MAPGPYGAEQDGPDSHGWNTVENFLHVHETRLAEHPFVDASRPHTLTFEGGELNGVEFHLLNGTVYCLHGVELEVTKYYETRMVSGRRQIRGYSYRYNAHVHNGHNLLRYDNGHDETPDEYHRHMFDAGTGEEVAKVILARHELPSFYDILTEVQELAETIFST